MASVIVVGGGLAGLTCAWRLSRAGHDVQVLEARSEAGGRVRREGFAGRRWAALDGGPGPADTNLCLLAAELGLGGRRRSAPEEPPRVLVGGRLVPWPLWRRAGMPWPARIVLGAELARAPREPRAANGRTARLDACSLAEVLGPRLGDALLEQTVAPALRARLDADPASVSAAFGLACLRAWTRPAPGTGPLAGGAGVLAEALAARVAVRTGCEVVRVETARDGARVRYRTARREGSVLADAVVVAAPPEVALALCPGLAARERRALASLPSARGMAVSMLLEKGAPAGAGTEWWIPREAATGLRAVRLTPAEPGGEVPGGVRVDALFDGEASERLWWADDDRLLEHAIDGLGATPLGCPAPVAHHVWRHDPLLARFEPGSLVRRAAFERRHVRTPRLAFAADALVAPGASGAVTSGMRAATEIAAELRERAASAAAG